MLQENPIWNDEAYSKDVREPDAYAKKREGKIKALALEGA
jgi:hypothetical protein